MPGRPFPGSEKVKRFVRGHIYHMRRSYAPEAREQVVIFNALNKSHVADYYIFHMLLVNRDEEHATKKDKRTVITALHIDDWFIEEVQLEDLPMFMYLAAYPEFGRILEGTSNLTFNRGRRRKRVSALRTKSADGRNGCRPRLKEET